MAMSRAVAAVVLACSVARSTAAMPGFLESQQTTRARVSEDLKMLLGHEGKRERLVTLEEILRPTFNAMPKNKHGGLDQKVARYALHRHFLAHRSWYIKGLAAEAEVPQDGSMTAEMLKAKMPSMVLDLLGDYMGSKYVGLQELAVLAAVIEDLVHSDSVDRLKSAYSVHGLQVDQSISLEDADLVMQTFTLFFIVPRIQEKADTKSKVLTALKKAPLFYPGWEDAKLWVEDLRHSNEFHDRTLVHPFHTAGDERWSFTAMAQWAGQVSSGFGRFSDMECKDMKHRLMDLEDEELLDGRVGLANFYGPYLEGTSFHFSESPEYLKHLGALDDHNPMQPAVIVPNIMYARSNCLATAGFHSICCIDDCEVLMASVEEQVVGGRASAAAVATAVSGLPSDTVAAPRNLSAPMLERLDEIAGRHGGSVPLHGRLFAQWMHYAFPNECPYPRSLLTADKQMTPTEWAQHWNGTKSIKASSEEMQAAVRMASTSAEQDVPQAPVMMWTDDEELLSEDDFVHTRGERLVATALRLTAFVAVLAASLRALAEYVEQLRRPGEDAKPKAAADATAPAIQADSASAWLRQLVGGRDSKTHSV